MGQLCSLPFLSIVLALKFVLVRPQKLDLFFEFLEDGITDVCIGARLGARPDTSIVLTYFGSPT